MRVVDVVDERVQRADPLRQAALDHRPFGRGQDARDQVERERPVAARAVGARDLERDALLHEDRIAPAPSREQRVGPQAQERRDERGGMRARRPVLVEQFVETASRDRVILDLCGHIHSQAA